ncbi:unnamed protein product [Rhizoctonia solani]|uniref:Uncharacterized protein n=1 Tax=Rhizoctonia solani TaxID=456999 RepID=A0A8H3DWJ1_9AGAM|nr:unnamed protein product [Rhizoctonia solani]
MSSPINMVVPTLALAWRVCLQLIAVAICCVFAWGILNVVRSIRHANPASAKTMFRRGKNNGAEHSPILSPFHPNAPAHPQEIYPLELMLRFLDETLNRLANFGPTLFGMVPTPEILQRLTYINNVRGPLNFRLNRGIAQISALRDQVVAHRTIIFRYLFPTTFLCCLLIGFGTVVNVSIEFIALMCSSALVLAIADESDFAPVRARAGLFATLFGWVGAL